MEASPVITVIIPTFNRSHKLKNLLRSLQEQACSKKNFEVIVVDDGSKDETEEMVRKMKTNYKLIYSKLSRNEGRATACNNGIRIAKGKTILFLDDDMILHNDLIAEHLRFHQRDHPTGVVGMVETTESEPRTRFENYFFKDVQYNSNRKLKAIKENSGNVPFRHCWMGNFSVSKQTLLEAGMFDESFKLYGYEDIEFAWRLSRKGTRIIFNPDAVAYHCVFPVELNDYLKKKEMTGYSAVHFCRKHPELKKALRIDEAFPFKGNSLEIIKNSVRAIIANRISVNLLRRWLPFFEKTLPDLLLFSTYNRISGYHLRKGLLKGLAKQRKSTQVR